MGYQYTIFLIWFFALFLGACRPKQPQAIVSISCDTVIESRLSLFFSGDYMQHLPQVAAAREPNGGFDYGGTLDLLAPFFKSADFCILNFETTLTDGPYAGYPCFRSPKASMGYLKEVGVDVLMLANNHCCDGGQKGVYTTLSAADSCGFVRVGVYCDSADYYSRHPVMLQKGSIRLALLNYTYGTNGIPIPAGVMVKEMDTALVAADIRQARLKGATDICVFYHWGTEYSVLPDKIQREWAEWTQRQGVRLIVGSHPHVVQPIEAEVADSLIQCLTVYSLGNLISNQPETPCKTGLSFSIELWRKGNEETRYKHPAYLFHWVDIEKGEGAARYRVIPAFYTDSLLNKGQADQFNLFRKQQRERMRSIDFLKEISDYP